MVNIRHTIGMKIESGVFAMQQMSKYLTVPMLVLTLTTVLYQYLQWHLETYLGISPSANLTGILVLFFITLLLCLLVGFILVYGGKSFSFQQKVTVGLNPYTNDVMTPKEMAFMEILLLILRGKEEDAIKNLKEICKTGVINLEKLRKVLEE